ncbi:Protein phosphatase 2C 71 [Quillaja saponaria]|uniref:Protein phosphatase 2C 71 n=1 Tax=Quillaja saponaria TaxID=32244 RepID=A0AAD7LP46_QUISA|nr:Protein phosphatase 2C 71 [Quillaja saponaria]
MLENPTPAISAPSDSATVIKRYAPPNQRTRSNNRRKPSSDRTNNLYANDIERNQVAASKNVPVIYHGDGSSILLNESHYSASITLEGCCNSAASRLLNDRWTAAMQCYNNPSIDSADKPVMHSGSTSAWGNFRLPHQIMSATDSVSPPGSQLDLLGELRRAKHNTSFNT